MAAADTRAARLRAKMRGGADALLESWGEWIDPNERLRDDLEFMGPGSWGSPFTTVNDREFGWYWPQYRTEMELSLIRGCGRNLSAIDAVAVGANEAMANYIFGGKGFKFTPQAKPKQTPPPKLLEMIRARLDRFFERNEFHGDLDRELHGRSREDGESFLILNQDEKGVTAQVIEPDQVRQPAEPENMYEWLSDHHGIDCDSFVPCWTFGILTPERNTAVKMGYHVIFDAGGLDWDFYPTDRVVHFKRNVTRNAKRGVSDYYPILEDMRGEAKLSKNMALGAALQAAIAWVEESVAGTTQGQVQGLGTTQADSIARRPTYNGGVRQTNKHRYLGGTILRPNPGRTYKPGPMGAERNEGFIEVASFMLRRIGIRWTFPEYMISGDASNANFASTLVSESPFVKARQADQEWYAKRFRSMAWKVIRIHYQSGEFDQFGMDWEQLTGMVDIHIEAPEVASRDTYKMAQTHEILLRTGEMSRRQGQIELGYDPDEMDAQGAKPQPTPQPGQHVAPGARTGAAALRTAADFAESLEEARALIEDYCTHGEYP